MTKKIRTSGTTYGPIQDTGSSLPRVEPAHVQAVLGAEESAEGLQAALAPVTLFAVREELVNRLQSNGGRPALVGVTRRAKIPLSDREWLQLEELAAAVASPGFAPSAGQVASVLLTLSLGSVTSHATSGQSSASLVRELAELVNAESA